MKNLVKQLENNNFSYCAETKRYFMSIVGNYLMSANVYVGNKEALFEFFVDLVPMRSLTFKNENLAIEELNKMITFINKHKVVEKP